MASHEDPGLFGPESVTWRVNREAVLLLGGGRALLLQVAHPSVATAVAQHSRFDSDPWGRLVRTLNLITRITFGDSATSQRAAERLQAVHRFIRGVRPDGEPYAAVDPDLLLWVWATLVESSLLVYSTFVGALSPSDVERYYAEQQRLALACGIPDGHWPDGHDEFRSYLDDMIETVLEVTPEARRIAESVLVPPLPTPLALAARPSVEWLKLTTVGLLPASLRAQYGLKWDPLRAGLFRASTATGRRVLSVVPPALRQIPAPR